MANFKGSYLGRFPLVLTDFWTSDHLSEPPRSVNSIFFFFFPWNARARNANVEATLNHPCPAQVAPRVAQRYVRRIATFQGRKFDVRFLVLVRNLGGDGADAVLWDDFWVRVARDAYGTAAPPHRRTAHLTAMHLVAPSTFDASLNPTAADFRAHVDATAPCSWAQVSRRVRAMAADARGPRFTTAAAPSGSRASRS